MGALTPLEHPLKDTLRLKVRVRGVVQGVGFRPTVYRLARDLDLSGDVRNDGEGVLIRLAGRQDQIDLFLSRLQAHPPPLARIDALECTPDSSDFPLSAAFVIARSGGGHPNAVVPPDAAVCPQCAAETLDPAHRRYWYPFTNCTHCGPRLSIISGIPYDRASTSMAAFTQCPTCAAEYADPANRRFHAQPNACPVCGPKAWLEDAAGQEMVLGVGEDALNRASALLQAGAILAIKGIGGFHLAVDATNEKAVTALRYRKQRDGKPFALMARDLAMIKCYCRVSEAEAALLHSPAAPILLLDRQVLAGGVPPLADAAAPGQNCLGFMLPYSPLHLLLMALLDRPLVFTSGNLSDEPPCIGNAEARRKLGAVADFLLMHDRDIVNRVDDSVARLVRGAPRLLRRARGYAPAPLPLPEGFGPAPDMMAMGGDLKNSFCLLKDGQAILSQHMGDLVQAVALSAFERSLDLYGDLLAHHPLGVAIDRHPDYLSARIGRARAETRGLPVFPIQHHHAHIAACLAENGRPLGAAPVLGIALDGLGYGDDGTLWGGEFLLADYGGYSRLAQLKPVALPGGEQAAREPWRNLVAQLFACPEGAEIFQEYGDLPAISQLSAKPLQAVRQMIVDGRFAPLASSTGRLFDAVAAALGMFPDHIQFEGQAAMALEAAVTDLAGGAPYPFAISNGDVVLLDPAPLWVALLRDLRAETPVGVIAARFHHGLAEGIAKMAQHLAKARLAPRFDTVALTGGVFQNRVLFSAVMDKLAAAGFQVLTHRDIPCNDGGIALGQALVAAAGHLQGRD
ncbi:MAG: carbamoyltransferase HypF [Magnetospiraceae bacterium]